MDKSFNWKQANVVCWVFLSFSLFLLYCVHDTYVFYTTKLQITNETIYILFKFVCVSALFLQLTAFLIGSSYTIMTHIEIYFIFIRSFVFN